MAKKELPQDGVYRIGVVSEVVFEEDPCCPHCLNGEETICLDESVPLDNHIAELHLCKDCAEMFLVVGYATLFETSSFIMMTITLKKGGKPTIEVTPSPMTRELMAGAQGVEMDKQADSVEVVH